MGWIFLVKLGLAACGASDAEKAAAADRLFAAEASTLREDYLAAADALRGVLCGPMTVADRTWHRNLLGYVLVQVEAWDEAIVVSEAIVATGDPAHADIARHRIMRAREALLRSKYGDVTNPPPDAVVVTGAPGQFELSKEHLALVGTYDDWSQNPPVDAGLLFVWESDRAATRLLAALVYRSHGQYPESNRRLRSIMADFPDSPTADTARAKLCEGPAGLECLPDSDYLFDLGKGGCVYKTETRFQQPTDEASAREYLKFLDEYPTSYFRTDARLNAARLFARAGLAGEAIVHFERFLQEHPDNPRGPSVRFELAATYLRVLDFESALRVYEAFVQLHPHHIDERPARYNAALLRAIQGDARGAALALETVFAQRASSNVSDPSDTGAYATLAAVLWEQVGEREALDYYQRYLAAYPEGDPNTRVQALARVAQILTRRGARGAAQAREELDLAFRMAPEGSLYHTTRAAAATLDVQAFEAQYRRYTSHGIGLSDSSQFSKMDGPKREELTALMWRGNDVISRYLVPSVAANILYYLGLAHLRFAEWATTLQAARGSTAAEQLGLRAKAATHWVVPSQDNARRYWRASIESATKNKYWNVWSTRAAEALHALDPATTLSGREPRRAALWPPPAVEEAAAREALVRDSRRWDILADQARQYLDTGQLDRANLVLSLLKQDERLNDQPDAAAWIWALYGVCGQRMGYPVDAQERFDRALALRPDDPDIVRLSVSLYLDRHRWADALPHLLHVTEVAPDHAGAWLDLGITLRGLGRPDEAAEAWRTAQRLAPDAPEPAYNLSILAEDGRPLP